VSDKKKASRFDDLIDAARSRQQRDKVQSLDSIESGETSVAKSKSTDPNYTRTTFYLPKDLHRKFKATAASEDKQMSDILIDLVEQWLKSK
jgi:hypothetical protein